MMDGNDATIIAMARQGMPTYRELSRATGLSIGPVWKRTQKLISAGYLESEPGKARTLRTTPAGDAVFPELVVVVPAKKVIGRSGGRYG